MNDHEMAEQLRGLIEADKMIHDEKNKQIERLQARVEALESKISEIRSAAEEYVYEPLGYGDEFTINYAIEASEVMGIIFDIASDALNRKEDTK